METKSGLDKTAWGDGPWQDEPDRAEWRDEVTGLPCLALRTERSGHWCGYVALPADHPWVEQDPIYIQKNGVEGTPGGFAPDLAVEVHGGITYGPARCQPLREDEEHPWLRICHAPRPGESDDVRWIGFDCHHTGYHEADFAPGSGSNFRGATYRDLPYVQAQCALLAKQAKEAIRVSD